MQEQSVRPDCLHTVDQYTAAAAALHSFPDSLLTVHRYTAAHTKTRTMRRIVWRHTGHRVMLGFAAHSRHSGPRPCSTPRATFT